MRSDCDAMSVTPAHPEPGPSHTELLLYDFAPGADFEGHLVGALERLESGGALRIIEVVFVHRDAATNELAAIDIPGDGAGGIAGPLLGFRLDAGDRARATKRAWRPAERRARRDAAPARRAPRARMLGGRRAHQARLARDARGRRRADRRKPGGQPVRRVRRRHGSARARALRLPPTASGRRPGPSDDRLDAAAMSEQTGALARAEAQVAAVRDDPAARLALMARVFHGPTGRAPRHLPFRRAALSFMRWQARRGVLDPLDASPPGSVWWRAVNERLLRDGCETVALLGGRAGEPSSRAMRLWMDFIADRRGATGTGRTTRASWPPTWSTATSPRRRTRPERFFLNVALLRVLYAHALVAAPRLALGRLARSAACSATRGWAWPGIFLSLGRILPDRYPLDARRRALHRRRAAARPPAGLRDHRAAAAAALRVVRRGARRTAAARAGARRQPGLRVAVRAARRLAARHMPLTGRVLERVTRVTPAQGPARP